MQGWVTYQIRKDRSLALASDPHAYEKSGRHRIIVKEKPGNIGGKNRSASLASSERECARNCGAAPVSPNTQKRSRGKT